MAFGPNQRQIPFLQASAGGNDIPVRHIESSSITSMELRLLSGAPSASSALAMNTAVVLGSSMATDLARMRAPTPCYFLLSRRIIFLSNIKGRVIKTGIYLIPPLP